MAALTATRQASLDEIVAEMDRRGKVIEQLEAEKAADLIRLNEDAQVMVEAAAKITSLRADRNRFRDALMNIDAVAVDFGHFETAARTMQEHARKALFSGDTTTVEKDDGPTAA